MLNLGDKTQNYCFAWQEVKPLKILDAACLHIGEVYWVWFLFKHREKHTKCSHLYHCYGTRNTCMKWLNIHTQGERGWDNHMHALSTYSSIYFFSLLWTLTGTEPHPVELLHLHCLSLPLSVSVSPALPFSLHLSLFLPLPALSVARFLSQLIWKTQPSLRSLSLNGWSLLLG